MFGEHDQDKAQHIADLATKHLGVKCIVVAGIVDPKKFTVAVPITKDTPAEMLEHLKIQTEKHKL